MHSRIRLNNCLSSPPRHFTALCAVVCNALAGGAALASDCSQRYTSSRLPPYHGRICALNCRPAGHRTCIPLREVVRNATASGACPSVVARYGDRLRDLPCCLLVHGPFSAAAALTNISHSSASPLWQSGALHVPLHRLSMSSLFRQPRQTLYPWSTTRPLPTPCCRLVAAIYPPSKRLG